MKRTIPQAVFDSPEALRVAKQGHLEACRLYEAIPDHLRGEGDPNHPMYRNKILGYDEKEFLEKQYK
jgi:hypothetical protein